MEKQTLKTLVTCLEQSNNDREAKRMRIEELEREWQASKDTLKIKDQSIQKLQSLFDSANYQKMDCENKLSDYIQANRLLSFGLLGLAILSISLIILIHHPF